jgi:hypothetical protein
MQVLMLSAYRRICVPMAMMMKNLLFVLLMMKANFF